MLYGFNIDDAKESGRKVRERLCVMVPTQPAEWNSSWKAPPNLPAVPAKSLKSKSRVWSSIMGGWVLASYGALQGFTYNELFVSPKVNFSCVSLFSYDNDIAVWERSTAALPGQGVPGLVSLLRPWSPPSTTGLALGHLNSEQASALSPLALLTDDVWKLHVSEQNLI